jgi:hypothetical protein
MIRRAQDSASQSYRIRGHPPLRRTAPGIRRGDDAVATEQLVQGSLKGPGITVMAVEPASIVGVVVGGLAALFRLSLGGAILASIGAMLAGTASVG